MRFSFARSAKRGVSNGTVSVSGGVDTRGGGSKVVGVRADAVPRFLLPLPRGCRLAGFPLLEFDSAIVKAVAWKMCEKVVVFLKRWIREVVNLVNVNIVFLCLNHGTKGTLNFLGSETSSLVIATDKKKKGVYF